MQDRLAFRYHFWDEGTDGSRRSHQIVLKKKGFFILKYVWEEKRETRRDQMLENYLKNFESKPLKNRKS